MKTLIFEPTLSGHHLEYLHHYYLGALEKQENEYIFLVPSSFEQVKDKYEWNKAHNIEFKYIDEKYNAQFSESNRYKLGWNASKILNHYVREIRPDDIILTMLMQFIPFIIFLLPGKVKVRGIMYKIYLYEQNRMSKLRLFFEKTRFWLAVRSKIIETIFVLNDSDSAQELNQIYQTNKFKYLPDPIPQVDMNKVRDLRLELKIPQNHTVYLHFGGLDQRKGTIDILKAIINAPRDQLYDKTFIFAGKQKNALKEQFYPLLEKASKNASILVYDEFCSYEFLYDLCYTCNIILMPYHITNLSSGVLGYAALFDKPVIGPTDGLVGKLIKKYNLGKVVRIPLSVNDLLCELKSNGNFSKYLFNNQVEKFIKNVI